MSEYPKITVVSSVSSVSSVSRWLRYLGQGRGWRRRIWVISLASGTIASGTIASGMITVGAIAAGAIAVGAIAGTPIAGTPIAVAQTLPLPSTLVPLNSPRGSLLLRQSRVQSDYVPLMVHFVTQDNQAFCGVASLVMVLNAMEIPRLDAPEWDQNYFTQGNVLDAATDAVIPKSLIQKQGMTLAELTGLFEARGVRARAYYGGDLDLAAFRRLAIANLEDSSNFMVVNYLRRAIGQERGGHISPLAAYEAATDRFLVLDVSRYKYPPVWVKAETLWQAIRTTDSTSQKTRGLVVVSRP
jgi:hypothetical protein